MKQIIPHLKKLVTEVFTVVTSRGGRKALLHDPLYSNAIYLMLTDIANVLFGFLFWILAARFYSAVDVGLATAVISAAYLLSMLSGIGLSYGIIRFLKSSSNPNTLINSSLITVGLISVIAALIFILGLGKWSPALVFIRENAFYFVAFVLIIPAIAMSQLTDQIYVAGRRAGYVLSRNLIFNILRLILVVALSISLHSFGIFASWGLSTAVALLVGILVFIPRSQAKYRPSFSFNWQILKDVLHFSFFNYISNICWNAPAYILPILVVNILDAESSAYFYVAWTLSGILIMIPNAFSTSLFAESSYQENNMERNVLRSLKMTFLLLIPAVILVVALADKLLLMYGGLYSQNATDLLRLIAVAALPLAVNTVYLSMKRVQKNIKAIIALTAFICVVTIVLSYILLPYTGITGTGIAWLVSQTIVTLLIGIKYLSKRLFARRQGVFTH